MCPESFIKNLNYKLRELEIIVKQIERDGEPSRIDVDLALDKTRELYDILLRLDEGSTKEIKKHKHSIPSGNPVLPSDPEPLEDEKEFEDEEIIPDPVHKYMDSPNSGSHYTEQQENSGKADKPETKNINELGENTGKKQNGSHEIEIVADRFQTSHNYVNKAMADRQKKKDIAARSQSRPITDLKNSIGLNEKFLFIKELFKGRPEKYNQCIEDLNQTSSYEEALNYVKDNYLWEEGDEVAEKLLNLVKRRHQVG